MGSSPTTQDFTFFATVSELQLKNTNWIKFVATIEEPGIYKAVNGSPSSICRLTFPLFQEYFQLQSLLNDSNASIIQLRSLTATRIWIIFHFFN